MSTMAFLAGAALRRRRGRTPAIVAVLVAASMLLGVIIMSTVTGSMTSLPGTDVDVDCTDVAAVGNVKATWNGTPYQVDQIANAQVIVGIGRQRGVPGYGWVVAIAAAMTESTLHNLDHGDRDSLGLFQMRPSMGWGTPAQLTDPVYAAGKFYEVLLKVPGWQSMTVTQAAQAVEQSGFPDAYARNEAAARALVADPVILSASCTGGNVPGSDVQQRVVAAAMARVGTPYSWGGGNWYGPTYGVDYGAKTFGFDCSGLTMYAWFQGSGGKVGLAHFTGDQMAASVPVDKAHIQAGDLLLFGSPGASVPDHVGMYDGHGGMIQAPHTGAYVEVTPSILTNSYWMGRLMMIGRPRAYTPGPQTAAPSASTPHS